MIRAGDHRGMRLRIALLLIVGLIGGACHSIDKDAFAHDPAPLATLPFNEPVAFGAGSQSGQVVPLQHGLLASYFAGAQYERLDHQQIDANVDFIWDATGNPVISAPDGLDHDDGDFRLPPSWGIWSVVWEGYLLAPASGTYLLRIHDEWRVPVLYVTHSVGEALSLAEAVLLLREGTVEAHGPALDLLSRPAISRAAESGIENLLTAQVVAHDVEGGTTRVVLDDGTALSIPLLSARGPGDAVSLAIRAEDILVAVEPVHGLSARNVVEVRIAAIDRIGRDALLRCGRAAGGRQWLVRITPSAVASLGLVSGRAVWLAIKSHSFRVL